MLLQIVNVLYVLVAIAMIGLILMQRGSGGQAGSGFGGGASATVFGSRGSSNFLTKSTKWLGVLFFAISLGMAYYASKMARVGDGPSSADLGVMGQPAQTRSPAPAAKVPTAQVPVAEIPQPATPVALPAGSAAAPAQQAPAPETPPQGN
ncbi:MAG: preprotein translocase subunit SecG [Pseudomonadota bacterium]|nr:preprotein translocase subunit SecG [Pseudomonadota bacterium]MDQ3160628.1 preprotein translocase subunit SecG [Pseudomonadota bacterium]